MGRIADDIGIRRAGLAVAVRILVDAIHDGRPVGIAGQIDRG